MDGFYYLPGDESSDPAPLSRYLPPVADGVASTFLAQHIGPEGWVLDPFGASPRTVLEMVRAGYRVLVAVNNPVIRFLIEMAASPPSQADLRAALSELASVRKGDERLENHLPSLYLTECTKCQRQVTAEAFVWERDSGELVARIYRCPCGESGEFPATDADKARAASLAATDSLHRARALERVATPEDPDRFHAQEALECYLPRAVYAIITIINKLDSLSLPADRRRALLALLLTACDDVNSLWTPQAERPRPKQLTISPRFLEKNVWLALERSVDLWAGGGKPVELTNWPSIPGEAGGLCLFEGPMRSLAPHLKDMAIGAIVTVLPRPNQAFWTLSALWTGWLWGREAASMFKTVLRRRRYDWNWQAAALYAALKNLSDRLPLNAPLFALIPELEPAFLSAALLAASGAGFDLNGLALRTRDDPAQVMWNRKAFSHQNRETNEIDPETVDQAIRSALRERREPAPYLHLHAAGLAAMAGDQSLRWREEALTRINAPIQAALAGPGFIHYANSKNPETGLWGLADWDEGIVPLSDRAEMVIVRALQKNPGISRARLETILNTELPGLLTPSLGLIREVLTSYAVEENGGWTLRLEDSPIARRTDLETAAQSLSILATRLGYSIERQESPQRLILWQESGQTAYAFHLLASAVAGQLIRRRAYQAECSLLVIPGGRAGLLSYKLGRDPSLKSEAEGWRIVKLRLLRRLAEVNDLTRERFEKELSSDPIEPPEQMKLF
jgi:hypothetical protein